MSRQAALEPAWLVGLLNQWALRTSRDKGLGYPTVCVMLKDGIPGRIHSYEPTGYGGADFEAVEQAVGQLALMRRLSVLRYFKPWGARAIDAEVPRDTDTWLYHLRLALAELAEGLDKLNENRALLALDRFCGYPVKS